MKSIKPGRGPSAMGAFAGFGVALFGIVWCIVAASMGAWFMLPFGIIFIVMAVGGAAYNAHNATSEDRYSVIDIVDEDEEPDPLNEKYGRKTTVESKRTTSAEGTRTILEEITGVASEETEKANSDKSDTNFCPYCGRAVEGDYEFCPKCGKKL